MDRRPILILTILISIVVILPILHYNYVTSQNNTKCTSSKLVEISVSYWTFGIQITEESLSVSLNQCVTILYDPNTQFVISSPWLVTGNEIGSDQITEITSFDPLKIDVPHWNTEFDIKFSALGLSSSIHVIVGDGNSYYYTVYGIYAIIAICLFTTGIILIRKWIEKNTKTLRIISPTRSGTLFVDPITYDKTLQVLSRIGYEIPVQLTRISELAGSDKLETEAIIQDLTKHHPDIGEYRELEQVFIKSRPFEKNTEDKTITIQINSMIEERRCCLLHGRMGDQYCNICGRIIPDEYRILE